MVCPCKKNSSKHFLINKTINLYTHTTDKNNYTVAVSFIHLAYNAV